jgi:hypothetical protein
MYLKDALQAWGTLDFEAIFKRELSTQEIPLQNYLRHGSVALQDNITIMPLAKWEDNTVIHVKTALLFSSVIAGCNCADESTPFETQAEYAEVEVLIDKLSGVSSFITT